MTSHPSTNTIEVLSVHMWDLRAQTEATLRSLTRIQSMLTEYAQASGASAVEIRDTLLADLADVVTISGHLQTTSTDALDAARQLR